MKDFLEFFSQSVMLSDILKAILILVLTFFCNWLVSRIEKIVFHRLASRTITTFDDKIIPIFGRAIRKLILLAGFYFALHQLQFILIPESRLLNIIDGAIYILAVIVIAHMLSSFFQTVLDWYGEKWGKNAKGGLQDEFRPLLRKLIVIVIYTIAIVHILRHFKQDISSLLVSLGVGSLAMALAAKDTLANMIAGFMIMTDRPFRLGDRIMLESGEKGDVYDIGLRTTKILTFDNTLIVVPNQQIVNEKVTNLSYPNPQIRVTIDIGVAYGTDLDHVKQILADICNNHPKVLHSPPPKAYFLNFGESSLDFKVVCRIGQWGEQWDVAEELRTEIYKVFEREKIEIPFPQRVVIMKNDKEEE
jgi:small-conductance mechanosensitive channel